MVRYRTVFLVLGWLLLCGSQLVHAQETQIAYGKPCTTAGSCALGLVCSLPQNGQIGYCVPQCTYPNNAQQFEPNSPQCPRREPCRRPAFEQQAGCFCLENSECPADQECNQHQCSAPKLGDAQIGEICDAKKTCGRGLLCTNAVFKNEYRCFPYCKNTCGDAGNCVSAPDVVGHDSNSTPFTACVCRQNSDCTSGICFDNVCRSIPKLGEPCTADSGCTGNLLCYFANRELQYGRCHPRCFFNGTCLAGERCRNGACVCSNEDPCKFGGVCQQSVCIDVLRCATDNDCESKRCFKPVVGESRQGICLQSCAKSADCAGGTPCLPLTGSGSACYCTRDSDCPDNRACTDNRCGEIKPPPRRPPTPPGPKPCDPACQTPFICRGGICVKLDIGETCTQGIECKSGVCFGPETDGGKVCSEIVSDCKRCEEFRMKCATFNEVQACYKPDGLGVSVFPPETNTGCQGCQSTDQTPSWTLLPLLFIWIMVRRLQS